MLDRFLAEYSLSVLGGILFLALAWFLAIWAGRAAQAAVLQRADIDTSFAPIVRRVVRFGIVAVAVLVVLDEFGVEVASIIAALGIFGFAIGLALRGLLANIFTGVAIFSLKPYKTGDEIVADRTTGVVESVHLFHTVLVSEGSYLSVPNDVVWAKPLRNLSRPRPWRVDLNVSIERPSIPAGTAVKDLRASLVAAMKENQLVARSVAPRARVLEVTEKTVVLRVSAWCEDELVQDLKQELRTILRDTLEGAGVKVGVIKTPADEAPKPAAVRRKPAAKPAPESEAAPEKSPKATAAPAADGGPEKKIDGSTPPARATHPVKRLPKRLSGGKRRNGVDRHVPGSSGPNRRRTRTTGRRRR